MTDRHIAKLWETLAEMYGSAFVSQFGEKDRGTWYRGLRDLTPEDLAEGIKGCFTRDNRFPPGLVEFRKLCRHERPLYHKTYKPLPKPKADQEVARKALDKMREALKEKPDYLDDLSKGKI